MYFLSIYLFVWYNIFRIILFSVPGYCQPCVNTIDADTGVIQSPGYPNPYPNDSQCTWIISTITDRNLSLHFDYFDIKWSHGCIEDFLNIFDKYKVLIQTCGTSISGKTFTSTNGMFQIVFGTSENDSNYKGFHATFNAISSVTSKRQSSNQHGLSSSKGSKAGVIIGASVGSVVLLVILIVFAIFIVRRQKLKNTMSTSNSCRGYANNNDNMQPFSIDNMSLDSNNRPRIQNTYAVLEPENITKDDVYQDNSSTYDILHKPRPKLNCSNEKDIYNMAVATDNEYGGQQMHAATENECYDTMSNLKPSASNVQDVYDTTVNAFRVHKVHKDTFNQVMNMEQ